MRDADCSWKARRSRGIRAAAMAMLALGILCESCRPRPAPPPAASAPAGASQTTEQSDLLSASTTPARPLTDYVGQAKCAECHAEIAKSHETSGHARTFALTKNSEIAKKLCGAKVSANAVDAGGNYAAYEYSCDEQGLTVACPEHFGGRLFPLDFAIGSGDHAVTFMTLQRDRDGQTVGIEHRISWFASDDALDLTPGHAGLAPAVEVELFGRVFATKDAARCIGCHTTTSRFENGVLTDMTPGVNCEKCHDAGLEHAKAAEAGDEALARQRIVRPKSAEEELQMCGSCHRTAEEIGAERVQAYRPSVVRFQPVGLSLSKCYSMSSGALRCTTCHDPHAPVNSKSLEQQIETCKSCHSSAEQKVCPKAPLENCIQCHMPALEIVPGISFHDHWIRVRDETAKPVTPDADAADHTTTGSTLPH